MRGRSRDDAVGALTAAKLQPDVHEVNSNEPAEHGDRAGPEAGRGGRGRDVGPDQRLRRAEAHRRPVRARPAVRVGARPAPGKPASPWRGATRTRTSHAGTVIDQSPAGGETAPRGATITLTVSRGPTDGGGARRDVARPATRHVATLEDSGFEANIAPGGRGGIRPSTASSSRRNPAGARRPSRARR